MTHPSIGDIPVDELDDYLEHYGVKGMKWGVRKDRKSKPSTADIAGARDRHNKRMADIELQINRANYTTNKKDRQVAIDKIRSTAKEARESGDIQVASKLTKGEKFVNTVAGGPLGAVTLYAAVKGNKNKGLFAEELMRQYEQVTVDDLED